ncbi:MAG: IS3 family transposase, partial [Candidatus Gracilibacteria bacterium]|nr:IS3 family transposase [Candidatus Gracilibacteria bacterium]
FFKSIKNEFLRFHKFNSFWEAKRVIFQYIEGFYNNNRLHSAIGYMTPKEKEKQLLMQLKNVT